MAGKLSWNDLALTPSQLEQLRGHGYSSPDAVAAAVAGAPEAFKGVLDEMAIARIHRLAPSIGQGRRYAMGVPIDAEAPKGIEHDPQFKLKRARALQRLNAAKTDEERALAERQLLDLYQRK